MVCSRCIKVVKAELDKLGIHYNSIELGEVTFEKMLTDKLRSQLSFALLQSGFELIDDRKNNLIEKLKMAIGDLENNSDEELKTSCTDYVSLSVKDNFISLNALFSEIKGTTIEKYIIKNKIDLVIELIKHNELSLAEIAAKMHYTSASQLSSQFKSITGLTPSHFIQIRNNWKINLASN